MKSKTIFQYSLVLFIMLSIINIMADEIVLIEHSDENTQTPGSLWSFWDQLNEPINPNSQFTWRDKDFVDDDAWQNGYSILGYGDSNDDTWLATDFDNYFDDPEDVFTFYFRNEFVNVNQSTISDYPYMILKVKVDDGAVIYLNDSNNELVRTDNCGTPGSFLEYGYDNCGPGIEPWVFQTFHFQYDPSWLSSVDNNVLAVEVHQYDPPGSSDLALDIELVLTDIPPPPETRKAPYLIYNGINTEMQLLWQLNDPFINSCKVYWGDGPNLDPSSQPNDIIEFITYLTNPNELIFNSTLNQLTPNLLHYYRVEIDDLTTSVDSFRTAPDDYATDVKFFVYGDSRSETFQHDEVAKKIYYTYTLDPSNPTNPFDPTMQTMIISVGDIVNIGHHEEDWDDDLFYPYATNIRNMMSTMPFQSCVGNHEVYNHGDGELFEKYFQYPYEEDNYGDDLSNYWAYDYGPAFIVNLDQYTFELDPSNPNNPFGDTQLAWIEDTLATTTKDWKFIVLHEPGWSAGDSHENNAFVQDIIQPLCTKYGVSFVFAGHNHYYARADTNGVHHITTGGGGVDLHDPDPTYPNIVETEASHHYCTIDINNDGNDDVLTFDVKRLDDSSIDGFSIEHYDQNDYPEIIDNIAHFIMGLQQSDGGIIDYPGADIINKDSTMEYALIGLAAAYKDTGDPAYLTALEEGIGWLADQQVMTRNDIDSINPVDWYGSWYFAYDASGEIVTDFGPDEIGMFHQRASDPDRSGIHNIRGVDTTCALFVYLVYLHYLLTDDPSIAIEYDLNARAACDFLINNSIDNTYLFLNGYSYSSWEQSAPGKKWERVNIQYSADQADVYLGLRAGSLLFPQESEYVNAADYLQNNTCSSVDATLHGFFDPQYDPYTQQPAGQDLSCYMTGRFSYPTNPDFFDLTYHPSNTFTGSFCQGYLPWVFGNNTNNNLAFNWITGGEDLHAYYNGTDYTLDFQNWTGASGNFNFLDYTPLVKWRLFNEPDVYDNVFSMNVFTYSLASQEIDPYNPPNEALNWLTSFGLYDGDDVGNNNGGIYDCVRTIGFEDTKYTNTAGFALMALTQFDNMLEEIPIVNDITTGTVIWDSPKLIANNFTVDANATLNIESDITFFGGCELVINGNVNIANGASVNMHLGTNIQVNSTGSLFLDWGSTITGSTPTLYPPSTPGGNEDPISGDRIDCLDGGMIKTDIPGNFTPGTDPIVAISSSTDYLWDGIFIKNPDHDPTGLNPYWFVNCDISGIRKLAIENIAETGYISNLKLYQTDFHDAGQLITRDGHLLYIHGEEGEVYNCHIYNNNTTPITAYDSPVDLSYCIIGGTISNPNIGNSGGIYIYDTQEHGSLINNCDIMYNSGVGVKLNGAHVEFHDNKIKYNGNFGMLCYDGTLFVSDLPFNTIEIIDNEYAEYIGWQLTYSMDDPLADITIYDEEIGLGSDQYLLMDILWDGVNSVDISGTTIQNDDRLSPQNDPDPNEPQAWVFGSEGSEEKMLLNSAIDNINNEDFSTAEQLLYSLISDYPLSLEAGMSVDYLYYLENITDKNFTGLRNSLLNISVANNSVLEKVKEKVITKTFMKDKDYLTAIDRLEVVIDNSQYPDEVIAAMIDEGYCYLELADGGERSLPSECTIKTATIDSYQEKVKELESLFSFYPEEENENLIPETIKTLTLSNYPNPFNPNTVINFSLPEDSEVELAIFNIKGQKVKTVVSEFLEVGLHSIEWNGTDSSNKKVASGVYFYQISAGKKMKLKKMLLLK